MQLDDLTPQRKLLAQRALKENFDTSIDLSKMNLSQTRTMLLKVRGLLSEARGRRNLHESHTSGTYMKLVVMEQMLTQHYGDLSVRPARLVVESEEVEQAQVVLAAQDMVDSIQKMIEQVSDMLVKELPAVVDGVSTQIGQEESQQYQQQATQTLSELQTALTTAKTGLQSSMDIITGAETGFPAESDALGDELNDELESDLESQLQTEPSEEEVSVEFEEPEENTGPLGRARR